MTLEQIIGDLKNKIYHPVYFLHGDETYYIDKLSDYIEQNILSESEKEFNQTIVYGKDLDIYTLISYARRYPMMSNYQVVIVKEAQDMKSLFSREDDEKGKVEKTKGKKNADEKDPLTEYLLKPTTSTLLVLCYKYGSVDKRKKVGKVLEKNSVFFESKKMYDDKLPEWITSYAKKIGLSINPKAAFLLSEYLGNDLTKITNELGKLKLNLKKGEEITAGMIEDNIGVSKDFNVFELLKAIGSRNTFKAFQIADYFEANPKNNPMPYTIPQLYSYFMKIMTYHQLDDRSRNNAASELGVNPYFLNDYIHAAKAYSVNHCIKNIKHISEYDMRSKGVNNLSTAEGALMKELIYKLLN